MSSESDSASVPDVTMEPPTHVWPKPNVWNTQIDASLVHHIREDIEYADSLRTPLATPLGLDAGRFRGPASLLQCRAADVVRSSSLEAGDAKGYVPQQPAGSIDKARIISRLLTFQAFITSCRAVCLIVDSRKPTEVDRWPSFRPWWQSRRSLFGRRRETTELLWFHIDSARVCQISVPLPSKCSAVGRATVPVQRSSPCYTVSWG